MLDVESKCLSGLVHFCCLENFIDCFPHPFAFRTDCQLLPAIRPRKSVIQLKLPATRCKFRTMIKQTDVSNIASASPADCASSWTSVVSCH